MNHDIISNPAHYTEGRSIEPANAIIDWELSWAVGNAVKYLARCGRNGDAVEDLRKAQWYIAREIQRLGGKP